MFKKVLVIPSWGKGSVTVSWEFSREPSPDHNVIILSGVSEDSLQNITEEGTLDREGRSFTDLKRVSVRRTHSLLYKVIVQTKGARWDSPVVSACHSMKPHEFAGLRTILSRELANMKAGNGIEVLLFKPLTFGEPADSYAPTTDRVLNPASDLSGFGERYRKGYFPPLKTFIQPVNHQDKEMFNNTGQGVQIETEVVARAFCFPRLAFRDLIIDPQSDDRYLVNSVKTHRFKGTVPLMCDVQLDLLPRNDIRYKLNVTDFTNI